jgi:hypothetical protein
LIIFLLLFNQVNQIAIIGTYGNKLVVEKILFEFNDVKRVAHQVNAVFDVAIARQKVDNILAQFQCALEYAKAVDRELVQVDLFVFVHIIDATPRRRQEYHVRSHKRTGVLGKVKKVLAYELDPIEAVVNPSVHLGTQKLVHVNVEGIRALEVLSKLYCVPTTTGKCIYNSIDEVTACS